MEKGALSEEVAINFGVQLAEIIAYLHKQRPTPILYLDLKPQNIIIKADQVFLVDFGNSMFLNSDRKYMSGTKGYAAPEQYTFKDIDLSTDIYGIGALLYFMVTGHTCGCDSIIFDTDVLVSDDFKKIIIQCMSPNGSERVSDALWVAEHLNEIIQKKFRKNNKKNNLLEKPLIVSVVGTQRHMGATHFSLALTSRLNETGVRSVYEDTSGKVIKTFYERSDKCKLSAGVYHYENILMKYAYSHIVTVDEKVNCKIVDCSDHKLEEEALKVSEVVLVIAGGKPWEMKNSIRVIQNLESICQNQKIVILWNFMKSCSGDCIPIFFDPFKRNADINDFLDKVISNIYEEKNVYKEEISKRFFGFFGRKKQF